MVSTSVFQTESESSNLSIHSTKWPISLMVKYLTVYQMSTVQFCYRSPICPYSEMANTHDFLSWGQGSNPCMDTIKNSAKKLINNCGHRNKRIYAIVINY